MQCKIYILFWCKIHQRQTVGHQAVKATFLSRKAQELMPATSVQRAGTEAEKFRSSFRQSPRPNSAIVTVCVSDHTDTFTFLQPQQCPNHLSSRARKIQGIANEPLSHRVFFDTGRNSRQLSPYNFVWETLKRLDRAIPATTPVIASSLYNIFTMTYRIVHRGVPLKLPFYALQLLYILFFEIYNGQAVAPRAVLAPN